MVLQPGLFILAVGARPALRLYISQAQSACQKNDSCGNNHFFVYFHCSHSLFFLLIFNVTSLTLLYMTGAFIWQKSFYQIQTGSNKKSHLNKIFKIKHIFIYIAYYINICFIFKTDYPAHRQRNGPLQSEGRFFVCNYVEDPSTNPNKAPVRNSLNPESPLSWCH